MELTFAVRVCSLTLVLLLFATFAALAAWGALE